MRRAFLPFAACCFLCWLSACARDGSTLDALAVSPQDCGNTCQYLDWSNNSSEGGINTNKPWRTAPGRICYQEVGPWLLQPLGQVHGASMAGFDFCELVHLAEPGSGVYSVDALVGVPELTDAGTYTDPTTYIELTLVHAWTDTAPSAPVLRLDFGPGPTCGISSGHSLMPTFRLGEKIGVFFLSQTEGNKGFRYVGPQNIWRRHPDDSWTNGILHLQADEAGTELGQLVRQVLGEEVDCPVDLTPAPSAAGPSPGE